MSDGNCNTVNQSQGMTNNVGFTFSVGDTIMWFTISFEQDNYNLVTPNITFSVYVLLA